MVPTSQIIEVPNTPAPITPPHVPSPVSPPVHTPPQTTPIITHFTTQSPNTSHHPLLEPKSEVKITHDQQQGMSLDMDNFANINIGEQVLCDNGLSFDEDMLTTPDTEAYFSTNDWFFTNQN